MTSVSVPRGRGLVAGLWGGLALTSGVALTATSGWLIVRASEMPVILTLLTAIVGVRAFGMARPFFRHLERLRSHDTALGDLAEARTAVYAGLIPLTPARLGRRSRSVVLTGVVDDLTDVVEAHVRVRVPVLSAALATGFAVLLTGVLLPHAGLVMVLWVGLVIAVARAGLGLERRAQGVVGSARAEVGRAAELVARHTPELRAIGAQTDVLDRLDAAHVRLDRALRLQSRGRSLVTAGVLVLTGVATVAMVVVARGAEVSAPVTALLIVVPVALADAVLPLADAMRAQARAEHSRLRVEDLLDQKPAVAGADAGADGDGAGARTGARVPHLRLESVTAGWTAGRHDIGPVSLDLAPGSRVALVGPNGSGKSTLLAVLARALDPQSGTFLVDGRDVTGLDLAEVRAHLAVVDDEPHLFAADLRANLLLAQPDAADDDLIAALTVAGLRSWFVGLDDGLATRLGTGGRGVSGGERARLALARAVLSGRPVVLLDEPVAHLDHTTATEVMRDVWAATAGRTVVVVSHRTEGLEGVDLMLELSRATSDAITSTTATPTTARTTP